MASRIEDYALISNSQSAALVGRDGSIDWLCLPRFDSGACFAALLGTSENGRWRIGPPLNLAARVRRTYRPGTLVLETEFELKDGSRARVIDFMMPGVKVPALFRIVEGVRGQVPFELELVLRFDYGSIVPWVRKIRNHSKNALSAIAGPDTVHVHSPIPLQGENFKTVAAFQVSAGERLAFTMTWHPSHELPSHEAHLLVSNTDQALERATRWWLDWSSQSTYRGKWMDSVERSLLTLKALTHSETGGIVAAPTTSLPERLGGVRNWDYRYCWLRDTTFTLYSLANAGFHEEARAWQQWLLRAVAGKPNDLRIMYGLGGERRLPELEIPWLKGYENAQPVRIGNLASTQLQLDVYGEVMDAFHVARRHDASMPRSEGKVCFDHDCRNWRLQLKLLDYLEHIWEMPDNGIWEVRGPQRNFTHSKVMAWVALDRGIKAVEEFGLDGPLGHWKEVRARIHEQVCREGFSVEKKAFVQYYGSRELDASLLMLPLVGFLPATDARMRSTIEQIEKELSLDGFILRYREENSDGVHHVDGLPPGEGAFLACTFWLADNLLLLGRQEDATRVFERLLSIQNDVGLLPEEYDPRSQRFVGNFPQAFSHVALVNSACNLSGSSLNPAQHRHAA